MSTQIGKENDQPLISVPKSKRTIFFMILYALFMFDFIARVGINSIFPIIQEDLKLTDVQVGMMGSVVLFGMAVFVLPISFLGEKHSPKKAITLSALIWSVGTLISGMASNFYVLLVSRFFVGSGNSAYAPLSNSLLTSMYPKKDWGKKIGIYNTGMTFGMALGAIVFANLANSFGWRAAFYSVGIISTILTIASLTLPDPKKILNKDASAKGAAAAPQHAKSEVNIKSAVQILGKNKSLIGVCLGAGFMSMVMQGMLSWLSIYFVREMDISISFAATLISILALISAFGYPIGGAIMDKWYPKDRRIRVFLPAICITFAAIFSFFGFYFKNIILIFAGGFLLTTACTSYHVATQELVPSWFKSVSYGVYVLFIQFFGAVGPLLIGALSSRFGLLEALIIAQVFNVLSIIIFLLVSRVYEEDLDHARQMEADSQRA